jgi:hypothetical protein
MIDASQRERSGPGDLNAHYLGRQQLDSNMDAGESVPLSFPKGLMVKGSPVPFQIGRTASQV